MGRKMHAVLYLTATTLLLFAGCTRTPEKVQPLKHYPIDSLEGILVRSGVTLDTEVTSDGNGSLRVSARQPRQVPLFETGEIDVENARLIYQAKIRTEDVSGKVYLEMWCRFPGKGEFFSRALHSAVTGTTDWTSQETPFFLKEGENPDNVKLNLVIDGTGTAWIDDVRLIKGPLK